MNYIITYKAKLMFSFILLLGLLCYEINIVAAQSPNLIAPKTKASTVLLEMKGAGRSSSQGSGFFVGNELVATNYHVVNGAKTGTAKLVVKQKRFEIEGVVATDKNHDLAIVKVRGLNAPPLPLGNSDTVEEGEIVYAVGSPRGFEGTFSSGNISGIRSQGTPRIRDKVLQFTAAISRGSSGGPVVNRWGQVIGIVSETRDDGQNLNFAIPVNTLKSLLTQVGPVTPFPNDKSLPGIKKQMPYPIILLITSVTVFLIIWFLPMVKFEQWQVAVGVALGFGAIKTLLTAIVSSDSLPVGIKSFLASPPPTDIGHALDCKDCIVGLIFYVIKLPIYFIFIAFLLGITNVVVRKFELNGFFSTFFVALLIVMGEILLRLLLPGV
ncbi:MAG: serine protease [Candidatus Poribacteria bacterium]|nr:serine protease [Candidatus Poribacteria bacterium]